MPERNLIVYCDESRAKGRYFSNFYGGAVVNEKFRIFIESELKACKEANNLGAELKWTKITEAYKDKYIKFVDSFFDLVAEGYIKVRIMFTQNSNEAIGLSEQQIGNKYWLLYYQMVKHAFGFAYCQREGVRTRLSVFLDDVPDKRSNFETFRDYVSGLTRSVEFREQNVHVPREEIADVNSKDHVILQGLDIILGSMQFRLNDMHLEKPAGKFRRSKRTRAKEEVYKHINKRIRDLHPGFNIGANTSFGDDRRKLWTHPYRHWLFVPKEHRVLVGVGKERNKRAPRRPT